MSHAIELRGVELALKHFKLRADLSLRHGITGLFGASGAGKTTLLEIIAGLRHPDRGQLTVFGRTVFDTDAKLWKPAHHRNIGYVPQDLALFPHLNVTDNIRYGEHGSSDSSTAVSFEKICRLLEIEKNLNQYPHSLSGGEKQRVAFARALMAQPSLLLLDEPLSGLDFGLKGKVIGFLLEIWHEFSIPMLYVTHSPAEVMTLCHEVILMENGSIVSRGRPEDMFTPTSVPMFQLNQRMDQPS